jgi:hypothetical protein
MTDIAEKKGSESTGMGMGTKIIIGLIGLVIVVGLLAALTLTVAVLDTPAGTSFPYSTTYRVSLPDGQPVTVGTTKIIVITYENEAIMEVDGQKEKLVVGQTREISPRYARVHALGVPLLDTDFKITLKYLGTSGKNALFDMNVQTSKQVPEMVISKLIPPGMGAVPA